MFESTIDSSGSLKDLYDDSKPISPGVKRKQTGSCSRCGDCCFKVFMPYMVFGGKCQFLLKEGDIYTCIIRVWIDDNPDVEMDWKANLPPFPVKVMYNDIEYTIAEVQFHYWRIECSKYPNPESEPNTKKIPERCSIILEVGE